MAEVRWDDEQPQSPLNPGGAVQWDAPAPTSRFPQVDAALEPINRILRYVPKAPATMAVPGGPALGMLGRGALTGGVSALDALTKGETDPTELGKSAALGGALSVGGDVAAKAGKHVFSAARHKMYSNKTANELAEWLRSQVPAWANVKGPRALYEMARGSKAQDALGDAYEKAILAAKDQIPEHLHAPISVELATKIGFSTKGVPVDPSGQVVVNVRELLGKLAGTTGATRRAILDALPEGAVPVAAMKEYAKGAGWGDFAQKAKLFEKGKRYDAERGQKGLRTVGRETLGKRGMQEGVENILRKSMGPDDITKGNMAGPLAAIGTLTGGTAGGAFGGLLGGGVGAPGGGIIGAHLGKTLPTYKNVPDIYPGLAQARRALIQLLGSKAHEQIRAQDAE